MSDQERSESAIRMRRNHHLNLDTDIYEPAVVVLKHLYPLIVPGGILILDDYGTFPGEAQAVDEYFRGRSIAIQKFPFAMTPCYIRKEPSD